MNKEGKRETILRRTSVKMHRIIMLLLFCRVYEAVAGAGGPIKTAP